MNKETFYKKAKTGKIQQWSVWVEKCGDSGFSECWIEHGLTDGKKQTTFDIIKEGVNIGKSNETSMYKQAVLTAERKIKKQQEEGYKKTVDEAKEQQSINFEERLPKALCFYKPKSKIDEKKLNKLDKSGNAILSVKRDGMCFICRKIKKFGVEIYSRRMDDITQSFPHLIEPLSSLPNDTILLGEMVKIKDDRDDFIAVSSVCRSKPDEAVRKQGKLGNLQYYVFDVAFVGGENLLVNKSFGERLKILQELVGGCDSKCILPVEIIEKTHEEAMKEIRARKLEGLVVRDATAKMKSGEAFSFDGDAKRPIGTWKWKPILETDVFVEWAPNNHIGDYGKGKLKGKFGNGFMYQWKDGEKFFLGKVGGGLSEELRDFYANESLFPRVWCVKFDKFQDKSGKLRFPVFVSDRTISGDKEISECQIDEGALEAIKLKIVDE